MRDRIATRFSSCVTPLVLGAVQFALTVVLPWTSLGISHPQPKPMPQQQAATPTPHKRHMLPPPVVRDIVKSATKVPALSAEDAFEDSLPTLTEGFAAE